jgi:hypothetical protein
MRQHCAHPPKRQSLFPMVIHLNAMPRDLDEVSSARARALGELATGFYPDMSWQNVEPQMASDWNRVRGTSRLCWNEVRDEAHAAWQVANLSKDCRCTDDKPVTMTNAA